MLGFYLDNGKEMETTKLSRGYVGLYRDDIGIIWALHRGNIGVVMRLQDLEVGLFGDWGLGLGF